MSIDVKRLAIAMHEAQVEGCFYLAHWETTGEGDPDDHLEEAARVVEEYEHLVPVVEPGPQLDTETRHLREQEAGG